MNNAEYKSEAGRIVEILEYISKAIDDSEVVDIPIERAIPMAIAVYQHKPRIQAVSANKKWNPPKGQIFKEGVYCLKCGQRLKQSKAGNWFCDCWIEYETYKEN